MQALHDAIQKKYGVSSEVSSQVVAALAEVEKHRQAAAGGQAQGFRARTSNDGGPTGGSASIPDINTIIRQTTGSSPSTTSNRNVSVQGSGSGLIGIIISIVMGLINMFIGSRMSNQSGGNAGAVTNILGDLLGGATHPGQAPDLSSVLGGLLGGSGSQSGNVQDIMQSMLGSQGSSSRPSMDQMTRPRSN